MSCKACDSPDRAEIDRQFSHGESARAIERWLAEHGHPITNPTLSGHRAHAIRPEMAEIEVHTNGEKPQMPTIRPVTSAEFLEQVVDQGAKIIERNPEKVKIDHALRAAVALERKKEDGRGGMRVLVLALTGHTPPATIRGTYSEIEGGS